MEEDGMKYKNCYKNNRTALLRPGGEGGTRRTSLDLETRESESVSGPPWRVLTGDMIL